MMGGSIFRDIQALTLMFLYAGIDEAGYGPMFGPLVIARAVFAVDRPADTADAPDLWSLLQAAVCRKPSDKQRRIAVDDSKKLYTPAAGLRHLERGLLSFAAAAHIACSDLSQWLHAVGYDNESRTPRLPWYGMNGDGGTQGRRDEGKEAELPASSLRPCVPTSLPVTLDTNLLHIAQSQLARALADTGVQLLTLNAATIYEDRFNRMVAATRSKSRCEWTFVAGHMLAIWQQFGRHKPLVVIDRQGGRTHYHDLLSLCFDGAKVIVLSETPDVCRYELTHGDRAMVVSFEAGSEERHLPVALASMTAKYTRELLMARFNAFWQSHDPSLKPTAGYVADGRRFLRDIEPLMQKLNIPHDALVRCR